MTKPAMATITAEIMNRSLPGCAIRVMFTKVSLGPVPGNLARVESASRMWWRGIRRPTARLRGPNKV
jgi:hypothetical protein